MAKKKLSDIAAKMREIDIVMLSTHTADGNIASRPMSNNRDVDYDGDSRYFTWEKSHMVGEIEKNPKVALALQGGGKFFLAVEGTARISRDKKDFAAHWTLDLDEWFQDGVDTAGVAMITVHAERATCWDGMEETEIEL